MNVNCEHLRLLDIDTDLARLVWFSYLMLSSAILSGLNTMLVASRPGSSRMRISMMSGMARLRLASPSSSVMFTDTSREGKETRGVSVLGTVNIFLNRYSKFSHSLRHIVLVCLALVDNVVSSAVHVAAGLNKGSSTLISRL